MKLTQICASAVAGLFLMVAGAAQAAPLVIDYEGIAPVANITTESGTRLFSNGTFQVTSHGHIVDSAWATSNGYANNGTDYYLHDNGSVFTIDTTDGSLFSLNSFDATAYHPSFSPFNIIVSGIFGAGGTISSSFTVINTSSFMTFLLSSSWVGLTSVSFLAPSGAGAFDNIVLNASASVPAPGALALLGLGLLGFGALRRKRAA